MGEAAYQRKGQHVSHLFVFGQLSAGICRIFVRHAVLHSPPITDGRVAYG